MFSCKYNQVVACFWLFRVFLETCDTKLKAVFVCAVSDCPWLLLWYEEKKKVLLDKDKLLGFVKLTAKDYGTCMYCLYLSILCHLFFMLWWCVTALTLWPPLCSSFCFCFNLCIQCWFSTNWFCSKGQAMFFHSWITFYLKKNHIVVAKCKEYSHKLTFICMSKKFKVLKFNLLK